MIQDVDLSKIYDYNYEIDKLDNIFRAFCITILMSFFSKTRESNWV